MRILFTFYFLGFISNVFSQPNNCVAFINNLPNMTVGENYEIIIDGNGGGSITAAVDDIEGTHNCIVEKWVFIGGNWLLTNNTSLGGIVTWVSGDKMIARGMSDLGNNSCSTVSGEDYIEAEDSDGNMVNKIVCVYSGVLPISYLCQPKTILIKNNTNVTWSVASQINNEKYVIEHSHPESFRDGSNFTPIGEIAGDGTSNETKNYEYIHTSPSIGMNYYRIKQVDYDGKYSYSDIASVRYDGNGKTSIYPNPATSEVTITNTAPTSLQIMDVYGRVLTKEDISEGQNTINLAGLPSGMLIFVVGDQRFKVLKE
jgi:hypothetical protein